MSEATPKVTIGLPVYNGERYLEAALSSLVAQSFGDIEVLISDNCSTDDTESICRGFATRDPRVRYVRNETNLGAAPNFNVLVERARGRYFKWHAHDDILEPEFVQRCVDVLDSEPDAVLAYPRAKDIDERGEFIKEHRTVPHLDSPLPHERLRYHICFNHPCLMVFGLMRIEQLRKTGLIGSYVSSDRVLLAELALLGRLREIPEFLLLHREHEGRSTRAIPRLHERLRWFDSTKATRVVFPEWKLLREYLGSIRKSSVDFACRLRCYFQILRWLRWRSPVLCQDLCVGAVQWWQLLTRRHSNRRSN